MIIAYKSNITITVLDKQLFQAAILIDIEMVPLEIIYINRHAQWMVKACNVNECNDALNIYRLNRHSLGNWNSSILTQPINHRIRQCFIPEDKKDKRDVRLREGFKKKSHELGTLYQQGGRGSETLN